jgi:cell wall-associated NlpC family hydrolase
MLSASNPTDVLTRSATLQAVGRGQSAAVAQFAAASAVAAAAQARAQDAAAKAQRAVDGAASARAVAATAVSLAQELLGKVQLSKKQLAVTSKKDKQKVSELIAERAAALAAARAAAARAATAQLRSLAAVNGFPEATEAQGKLALQWAESQLGVPYSWGGGDANGPTLGFVESETITSGASTIGFDCSGLALFAWAHAGYALQHYTGAQWVEGTPVDQKDLRPGDLVFFATDTSDPSTIHHVGIYAGDGKMIDAPETGSVVRYDDAFRPGYIGAVRP